MENEEQPHDKGILKMEPGISVWKLNSATQLPAVAGIRPDGWGDPLAYVKVRAD